MEVKTKIVGSLFTNCYMAYAQDSDSCILIDPGYSPEELLEWVQTQRKTLAAILLTHGHFDHTGAVKELAQQTGCPVYLHEGDKDMSARLSGGGPYYTHTYAEGDQLTLAGLQLQVLHTPGHTPGCVCILADGVMFSGDTLFAGTCGRTDLPGGDFQQMRQSLARLAKLEGDYQVLPGHGESSTLALERRFNPYMQPQLW